MSYGTMIDRIEDEIARTDLTSNVKASIISAINFYEREPWWFLEDRSDTFTTSNDQEFYGSVDASWIATVSQINALTITISANRYRLTQRTYQYLEDTSIQATSLGQPQDYAYYAKQIRLYPIPSEAYQVRASYNKKTTTFSDTADTSNWLLDAEELIRCRAKWDIFAHVIREVNEAEYLKALEREAYGQLKGEGVGKYSAGVTPTLF